MAHSLYTTHHIQRRYWVAHAIPVVLVMASIVWAVMVFGERPTFGVHWDWSQMAPPPSNSVPSRPTEIGDLSGLLGGKCLHRLVAARTSLCG
jgi:hypothetical protein